MKLKNGLNVYIAFHIANDLDRVSSMNDIVKTMNDIYGKTSRQVFVDDEHRLIEDTLNNVVADDITGDRRHQAKVKWEKYQEKKHSISGTEIIYKIQKPLMISKETDIFFQNLYEVLLKLNEYYPHFTQIDDKNEKGKGIG